MAALCTVADITTLYDIAPGAQPGLTLAQFNGHISYASADFISAARSVYDVPNNWSPDPATVGEDCNQIVAAIAGYRLLVMRGLDDPNNPAYKGLYSEAMRRLDSMQDDIIHLPLPLKDVRPVVQTQNRGSFCSIGGVLEYPTTRGR
jgi:hypothetical protein